MSWNVDFHTFRERDLNSLQSTFERIFDLSLFDFHLKQTYFVDIPEDSRTFGEESGYQWRFDNADMSVSMATHLGRRRERALPFHFLAQVIRAGGTITVD